MAKSEKEEKEEKEPVDPDQDIWDAYGIDDDDEKARVRSLAAARELAHRRINRKSEKKKSGKWGEE